MALWSGGLGLGGDGGSESFARASFPASSPLSPSSRVDHPDRVLPWTIDEIS